MEKVPEIGKVYAVYDDGKIKKSRKYEVVIDKIIPFEEIDKDILRLWKEEVEESYWLYSKDTDYFIFVVDRSEIFVRTLDGGWFGIGDFFDCGRLDISGKLTEKLRNI